MFPVAQWKNVLYFGAKSNRRYWRLTEIKRACALRIGLKFEMGLSPNRYIPEGVVQHRR